MWIHLGPFPFSSGWVFPCDTWVFPLIQQRSAGRRSAVTPRQKSLAEIEALKKKATENKERLGATLIASDASCTQLTAEKSASDIFDETRIASMTAMEIREAGDKNQQAFKGTMEAAVALASAVGCGVMSVGISGGGAAATWCFAHLCAGRWCLCKCQRA
eukprot:Skav209800  [mRNA]  locus=scaffold1201:257634:260531:- [translate_table: standard]